MSSTVTTPHHRAPWIAAAAVAAVIGGAGVVSLAWDGSSGSVSHDQSPALTPATLHDYSLYHYYHGPHTYEGLDGHVPPAPPVTAGSGQGHESSPATTSGGQPQIGP